MPRAQKSAPAESPAAQEQEMIHRNFAIPVEDAEWLRVQAFTDNVSQAVIVREAIRDVRKKYDRRAARRPS